MFEDVLRGVRDVTQDLLDWSQRRREWIAELVQREVKRQLSAAGIATREDLDALRKRVRELERASGRPRKASTRSGSSKASRPSPSAPTPIPIEGSPESGAGVGDPSPPGP
jgi:BMFP domain-containing protein YqiC